MTLTARAVTMRMTPAGTPRPIVHIDYGPGLWAMCYTDEINYVLNTIFKDNSW